MLPQQPFPRDQSNDRTRDWPSPGGDTSEDGPRGQLPLSLPSSPPRCQRPPTPAPSPAHRHAFYNQMTNSLSSWESRTERNQNTENRVFCSRGCVGGSAGESALGFVVYGWGQGGGVLTVEREYRAERRVGREAAPVTPGTPHGSAEGGVVSFSVLQLRTLTLRPRLCSVPRGGLVGGQPGWSVCSVTGGPSCPFPSWEELGCICHFHGGASGSAPSSDPPLTGHLQCP